MGWHPSGVKRTRIRVIGVIFSYFLIKGKEFQFELAGNSRYPTKSDPREKGLKSSERGVRVMGILVQYNWAKYRCRARFGILAIIIMHGLTSKINNIYLLPQYFRAGEEYYFALLSVLQNVNNCIRTLLVLTSSVCTGSQYLRQVIKHLPTFICLTSMIIYPKLRFSSLRNQCILPTEPFNCVNVKASF